MKKINRKIEILIDKYQERRENYFWAFAVSSAFLFFLSILLLCWGMSGRMAEGSLNLAQYTCGILIYTFGFGVMLGLWVCDVWMTIQEEIARMRIGKSSDKNFFGEYLE